MHKEEIVRNWARGSSAMEFMSIDASVCVCLWVMEARNDCPFDAIHRITGFCDGHKIMLDFVLCEDSFQFNTCSVITYTHYAPTCMHPNDPNMPAHFKMHCIKTLWNVFGEQQIIRHRVVAVSLKGRKTTNDPIPPPFVRTILLQPSWQRKRSAVPIVGSILPSKIVNRYYHYAIDCCTFGSMALLLRDCKPSKIYARTLFTFRTRTRVPHLMAYMACVCDALQRYSFILFIIRGCLWMCARKLHCYSLYSCESSFACHSCRYIRVKSSDVDGT